MSIGTQADQSKPEHDPGPDLPAQAGSLYRQGRSAHEICEDIARRGCPAPAAADIVRALPGLSIWDPVEDWRDRWQEGAEYRTEIEQRWQKEVDARPEVEERDSPTVEEARRRRRGERLARIVREHARELLPVLVEMLTPTIRSIVREVLAEDLPEAVGYLLNREAS